MEKDTKKKTRVYEKLYNDKNHFWKNEVLINLREEEPVKQGGLLELR